MSCKVRRYQQQQQQQQPASCLIDDRRHHDVAPTIEIILPQHQRTSSITWETTVDRDDNNEDDNNDATTESSSYHSLSHKIDNDEDAIVLDTFDGDVSLSQDFLEESLRGRLPAVKTSSSVPDYNRPTTTTTTTIAKPIPLPPTVVVKQKKQKQKQQPDCSFKQQTTEHTKTTVDLSQNDDGEDAVDYDSYDILNNISSLRSMNSISTLRTTTDEIIVKKLSDYGIVPLERKRVPTDTLPTQVKDTVDQVHRWLFVDGGHCEDVEAYLSSYGELLRRLRVPADRIFYGGIGLHPKLTAYQWRWEYHDDDEDDEQEEEVRFSEMPQEIFERRNELFSPDEPFCVLEQGRAESVRIKHTDTYIPPDTAKWFRDGNYTDYFALPDIHRNQSKGGLAWATKHPNGFSDDDISLFKVTMPALTNVLRLHTNDLVLSTLTERMEQEIEDRTEELANANLELENANKRLEVQRKKQLEHFACMSHEIRTPLNCIVGLSSVLLESPEDLTPSAADSIQMMKQSADLLHGVVNDVLDYSKMESGAFEVDIRSSNLQDTLNSVVHAMQEKAAEKQVFIRTSYGASLPEYIDTDPRRIQQIFYNLLGNACKFSKPGGNVDLTVTIEQQQDDDNDKRSPSRSILKCSVKDYGKGIDEKDFESVFKPFNQAGKETHTIYGGTGLGLSITSKLVERLEGTISIDSKVSEYTEFVVVLPANYHHHDHDGNNKNEQDKEEPMNVVSELSPHFENVTIVLLNDVRTRNHPFGPAVVDKYNVNFREFSTWDEIKEATTPPSSSNTQDRLQDEEHHHEDNLRRYVLIAPADRFEPIAFKLFSRRVQGRCHLVTYGQHHNRQQQGTMDATHWASLSKLFPTVAFQSILTLIQQEGESDQQAARQSNIPEGSCSLSTLGDSKPTEAYDIPGASQQGADVQQPVIDVPTAPKKATQAGLFSPLSMFCPTTQRKAEPTTRSGLFTPIGSYPKLVTAPPSSPSTEKVLRADRKKRSDEKTETLSPTHVSTLKVLYAEDNKINQKVFGRMLTKIGVSDLDIVDNGQLAVDASANKDYDIIFMDIQMPVMDGLEATQIIKKRDDIKTEDGNDNHHEKNRIKEPKIIFCTAHVLDDFRTQCDQINADGFVSKPFNLKRIQELLTDHVNNEDGKVEKTDAISHA